MAIDWDNEETKFIVHRKDKFAFIFNHDFHGDNCILFVSDSQVLLHGLCGLGCVLPHCSHGTQSFGIISGLQRTASLSLLTT